MTDTSKTLTIISWNVNRRKSAWEDIKRFGADIVLLQEATGSGIPKKSDFTVIEPPTDNWTIQNGGGAHGTAIAIMNVDLDFTALMPVPLGFSSQGTIASSHPGQFSVVKLKVGKRDTYLISIYGILKYDYADGALHRAISDITPLLESGAEVLVAGDLNSFRGYSVSGSDHAVERHQALFDRFSLLGLECIGPFSTSGPLANCPCGDAERCDHVHTYRHMNRDGGRAFQNDYVLATEGLRERLVSCKALTDQNPELWSLSDHAPIEVVLQR